MGRSNRIHPAFLGKKLKTIRQSLGLTQEQLIKRLDYSKSNLYPQNISGFENSEREPNLVILLAYAQLVNITTDLLIDDSVNLTKFKKILAI
jgi:transcriptional regulator with XRE-family HTH domain